MRPTLCALLALSILGLAVPSVDAQINPFRSSRNSPSLSPEDNAMLFASIDRLNEAQPHQVGQSDSWTNPQTGSTGVSTIQRIFRSHGTDCHSVHHEISVQGRTPGRGYDLKWCQAANGTWKIVN
jgi:hypothetical protein